MKRAASGDSLRSLTRVGRLAGRTKRVCRVVLMSSTEPSEDVDTHDDRKNNLDRTLDANLKGVRRIP